MSSVAARSSVAWLPLSANILTALTLSANILTALTLSANILAALAVSAEEPGFSMRFEDVTSAAGLSQPLAGMMGHGAAWGDFDGDGLLDLYVGGYCDRPDRDYAPAPGPVPNRMFRNLGNGRFAQVKPGGIELYARTTGALLVDLDNDATAELYVANNARSHTGRTTEPQRSAQLCRSRLYRNEQGRLVDITDSSGACPAALLSVRNVGPLDFDGDGLLDLLLIEDRFIARPRSVLLRNLGGLRFAEANAAAGLPDDLFGLGLAIADLNGDRLPDFFVAHSNRLFLSTGDGKYREALELRKVIAHQPLSGEDWPCGAAFGDLNGDGLLDLVIGVHHNPARNRVFINYGLRDGVPDFRDVTDRVGLRDPVPAKCAHVEIQDFDNDGRADIYFSAAWLDGDQLTPLIYRNHAQSDGLPVFKPLRPIKPPMVSFATGPSADFDGDGRRDLLLVSWFPQLRTRLLRNVTAPQQWLTVRARGSRSNRMAIGAQVFVYRAGQAGRSDALLGFQEIATGYGYSAGQPAECHFGLGDHRQVDLRVRFPSGATLDRPNVQSCQILTVDEP